MKSETFDAACDHARADYPRESCGLVVIVKGRERYVPCRNIAETPSEHFILAPEDYANAEDLGEVTALVHSHPDEAARPSEPDRVACEESGLPWHIIAVHKDGEVLTIAGTEAIEPCGYMAPLVGRTFAHGVLDCYTLIQDWFAREVSITLPDFDRTDEWWNRGEDLYLKHFAEAGFVVIDDEPQRGDVILMQILAPQVNHGAVFLGDGSLMLHHLYGRLSSRDVYGGQWAEKTRLIVRHKDLFQPAS